MLEHGARCEVAQLGLDKSSQIAGSVFSDAEKNGVQIIVCLIIISPGRS